MIVLTPTDKDPRRHTLYVRADMTDLSALVRKLGAMCGRPQRERVKTEYNYSMYLKGLTPLGLRQVENMMSTLCPQNQEAHASVSSDVPRPEIASGAAGFGVISEPISEQTPEAVFPAPQQPYPPPTPEPPPSAASPRTPGGKYPPSAAPSAASPRTAVPEVVLEAGKDVQPLPAAAVPGVVPGAPAMPVPPQEPPRQQEGLGLIDLSRMASPEPAKPLPESHNPPLSGAPAPPVKEPVVEDLVQKTENPTVFPASSARLAEQPLWGAVLPLDLTYTMDTLMVGPFNRFAHAASIAVVSNPGMMYNPLFIYGAPGVGKTHLLLALARSLQDQQSAEPVFFTSGPRLARAAELAVASGRTRELEDFAKKSRALLVDDAHLLAVSERNQPVLTAVLHHYFSSSKAVAMTSVYPPRVLGGLEESLKFQLSAGWAVEMKVPTPDLQKSIISASMARLGFKANEAEEKDFQSRLGNDFFDVDRWLRRLLSLQKILEESGRSGNLREMTPLLFAQEGVAQSLSEEDVQRLLTGLPAPPPIDPARAKNLAVFFPLGKEGHARYAVAQMQVFARQYGLSFSLKQVGAHVYDPEQLYGVPFAMREQCDRLGADAVLVLGPTPGSGLANREGELVHALEHILRGIDAHLAWFPFTRLKEANFYLRGILDLYPVIKAAK